MQRYLTLAVLTSVLLPLVVRADDQTSRGEKYALLVGVSRYVTKDLRELPYSERDVSDLAQVLRQSGYRPENVVVMTQTASVEDPRFAPSVSRIRAELALLLKNRRSNDTVLIAFAGHGLHFKGDADSYFCPADAEPLARKNLLSLTEVYKQLEGCQAGFKLLLVDACRNDPFRDRSRARSEFDGESATRPALAQPPGGVVAFFSCSQAERAFEDDGLKHGIFFHFVIEALKGAAAGNSDEITLAVLSDYVSRQVADFVRAKYGQAQTPELIGKQRGIFPLVRLDRLGQAIRRAKDCVERGEVEKVLTEAAAVLRHNPRSAMAHALRGEAYRLMGQLDKAHEAYEAALRLDPGCMEAYSGRGWLHVDQTKWSKAAADFREALRLLQPRTAEAYIERCVVYLGLAEISRTYFDQALTDAEEALRLDPKMVMAHVYRAFAYEGKKRYKQALASANAALRLDPTHAAAYLVRGRIHFFMENYDRGSADLSEAILRAPKVSFLYSLRALARAGNKDYDQALADCNEALRLAPQLGSGYTVRAVIHNLRESYDAALADCTEALRRAPSCAEAYSIRAVAHAGKNLTQQALADLNEAIRIDAKNPDYYTARAEVYDLLGDTTKAQADTDRARKLGGK